MRTASQCGIKESCFELVTPKDIMRKNLPDFVFPVYVFDGLCWDFVLFLDL